MQSTTQLPPESGHSYSSTIQVNAETSRPPSSMSDADIVRPLVDLSPLGELVCGLIWTISIFFRLETVSTTL